MAQEQELPLLLFPTSTISEKDKRRPPWPRLHVPTHDRQRERLTPKFNALQNNFERQRLQLQRDDPGEDPELVLVFETVGPVEGFLGAVRRTAGLEWLLESEEVGIPADDDFYSLDDDNARQENSLKGTLFLLGTNRQALTEIIALWERYRDDPSARFDHGFSKWKDVFKHLRDVRFWDVQERIGPDIRQFWQSRLNEGGQLIRFEIEAWCYRSVEKNDASATEIAALTGRLGGRVLHSALLTEIAYHGFLVELPAESVREIIDGHHPALALSERVMFFRPQGQGLADNGNTEDVRPSALVGEVGESEGMPAVALLDGLPLQNHPLLQGRLLVDDPDEWGANYPATDRNHGTAMASLIVHGELDARASPLRSPLYVRPILRPDPLDQNRPRLETTPNDRLLIDLFHQAVRRIFEGEGDTRAVAPTVKVINLSVGDGNRPFDTDLSPWARLVDWLSEKYNVLFVISAGNMSSDLTLDIPRESIGTMDDETRKRLVLTEGLSNTAQRRIIAPAEAMNPLTIGATHRDSSPAPVAHGRFDLLPRGAMALYSRVGHGYRRIIKPDIMLPGGRILYRERLTGPPGSTILAGVNGVAAPGHRVAAPPNQAGENTKYCRGTSNAAALASRWAGLAHGVIESLRNGRADALPEEFDAVLIKALLVHGAKWGALGERIGELRRDLNAARKKDFVARIIGYGRANVARALECTQERATLLGVGSVSDGEAIEFRAPLPPCLIAQTVRRRLTVTLAWISPTNGRHAKYRSARLWVAPPDGDFGVTRQDCNWQHVRRGTLQHEVLEGDEALAFVDGATLLFKVNCAKDANILERPVRFALCVSIEVGEGLGLPVYQEVRERVQARVGIAPQ